MIGGGYLTDRFAPRWLACGSGVGMAAGLWLAAAWPSLSGIVLGFGLVHGSAAGLGYATAVHQAGIINHGLALALVVSAYGAGSAILALPIGWLTAASGYSSAFLALSVFAGVACALAACLLPGRRPRNVSFSPRNNAVNISRFSGLLAFFWLMFGLGSAPGFIAFALAGKLAGATAYSAVIAVNLGNLGGRLLAGILSDRLGTNRVLHGNFAFLILACGLLALVRSSGLAQIGLLMVGLQYGALSTLLPLSVRRYVPTAAFGRCFGIVFSSWGVCGLATPLIASALADSRELGCGGCQGSCPMNSCGL